MFPSVAVLPYLFVHGLLCAVAGVAVLRWIARGPTIWRGFLGLVMVGGAGAIVSLVTAPRAEGMTAFAIALALAWTIFLVVPAFAFVVAVRMYGRPMASGMLALAFAVGAVGIFAFVVEPHRLTVSRHDVVSTKVNAPLTIAVISDLQTDDPGAYEREALARVMAERPDVIVFTGDVIQIADQERYARAWIRLRELIAEVDLHAPLGIYAVRGDVDPRGRWLSELDGTDIIGIEGPTLTVPLRDDVTLTALDLPASASVELAIAAVSRFHVVIGHRPDFALGTIHADLLLAGHTHGGQVQLPGFGPLATASHVPRDWAYGRTEISEGRTLIVSRGVGMERGVAPRLRLFCAPEIVIVRVLPDLGTG